jgi:hypothetical protein
VLLLRRAFVRWTTIEIGGTPFGRREKFAVVVIVVVDAVVLLFHSQNLVAIWLLMFEVLQVTHSWDGDDDESRLALCGVLAGSRVTRCVCEKVAQNVALSFFVKINTCLLPLIKVAQLFVLLL